MNAMDFRERRSRDALLRWDDPGSMDEDNAIRPSGALQMTMALLHTWNTLGYRGVGRKAGCFPDWLIPRGPYVHNL